MDWALAPLTADQLSHPLARYICVAGAVALPVLYVGSIYVFDRSKQPRVHPESIRQRVVGAVTTSVAAATLSYAIIRWSGDLAPFARLGLAPESLKRFAASVIFPSALTAVLYAGNWAAAIMDEGRWRDWFDLAVWRYTVRQPDWRREAIWAPLSEELCYRAGTAALLSVVFSPTTVIAVSPLFFALSHLHHIIEDCKNGGYTLRQAIANRLFQVAFTYLFGVYATFIFARTGNLVSCIVTHSICNQMGLPELGGPRPLLLLTLHVLGLASFLVLLGPLTTTRL